MELNIRQLLKILGFDESEILPLGVGVKTVQSQKHLGTMLNDLIYGKHDMFEVSGKNFKF